MSKQNHYLETRISQLKQDMSKAHDEHDKAWYNRLIQELDWAAQMGAKADHNCYMEKREKHQTLMETPIGATGGKEIWT